MREVVLIAGILKALDINGTFLAQMVDFVLLLVFMRLFVWPPLTRAMAERRRRIQQELADAEAQRLAAVAARDAQQLALDGARAEAEAILERARRVAAEEARTVLEEARAQSERSQQQAREEIGRERAAAIAALRGEVADLVITATERLLRVRLNENEDRRLVDEFIASVGAGDRS